MRRKRVRAASVTALVLAEQHPDLVDLVIAHEPPLNELLADRHERHGQTEEIIATYVSSGRTAAWRRFLADANIAMPEEAFQYTFGGELGAQQAADEDHFFLHELRPTTHWRPDIEALRNATTHIVVGIGEKSTGELCERTGTALAAALDLQPTMFPGGHIGFAEDPQGFHTRLRGVLTGG